jgi:salicylate hydroxylase
MLNKINIIGAGVCGLFLGYCLKKNGFNPIIYEKDKALSDYGAGVNLSRNATILLKEVGILKKLSEYAYFPNKVNFRSFHNSSVIKSLQLNKDNSDFISIDRKDLIRVLASEYINLGGEIKFNHELEQVNSSKIFFKDNSSYETSLTLACDGIKSKIRENNFNEESPKFTGLIAWRGIVDLKKLPKKKIWTEINIHLGPGGHIVHYPISNGKRINFVAIKQQNTWEEESWILEGKRDQLLIEFNNWNSEIKELFNKSLKINKWGLFERKATKTLINKNIILMGDAAHPMLPFLAQGSCLAIEDAFTFSHLLKNKKIDLFLKQYEILRVARGNKVQARSKRQGKVNHLSNKIAVFLRNLLLKIFAERTQRSIHQYNVIREIQRLPN